MKKPAVRGRNEEVLMGYGKVEFEHVWRYQIGCMMANQYSALLKAIGAKRPDDIIAACLRLGWNDAFKHVSENTKKFQTLSDADKTEEVDSACKKLVPYFKEYAQKTDSKGRYDVMAQWIANSSLDAVFSPIKEIRSDKYPLCLGHIQKMFNIALKLLLCLIISAEHAREAIAAKIIVGNVKLGEEVNGADVYLNDDILSYEQFPFEFDTADCPIDHYALEAVEQKKTRSLYAIQNSSKIKKYDSIVWSKMGDVDKGAKEYQEYYLAAQQEIGRIQSGTQKSNLCFDFENWK